MCIIVNKVTNQPNQGEGASRRTETRTFGRNEVTERRRRRQCETITASNTPPTTSISSPKRQFNLRRARCPILPSPYAGTRHARRPTDRLARPAPHPHWWSAARRGERRGRPIGRGRGAARRVVPATSISGLTHLNAGSGAGGGRFQGADDTMSVR